MHRAAFLKAEEPHRGLSCREGSFGHITLHALTGCIAAEAQGASCASGAAAGLAQGIYAGTNPSAGTLTDDQIKNRAELIGGIAGFFASEGKAENVSTAASIARSGVENNYLNHTETLEKARAEALCNDGNQAACQRAAELTALDESRDDALKSACRADIHGATCKSHMKALTQANVSFQQDSIGSYETRDEYLEEIGAENVNALMTEYLQLNQMVAILNQDPELAAVAASVLHKAWTANQSVGVRILAGFAYAGADSIQDMHQLANALVTDPGSIADAIGAIIDDPSLLPEALWQPFKTRITVNEAAKQLGVSRVQIWRMENKTETISAQRLFIIAAIYGVDPYLLFKGTRSTTESTSVLYRRIGVVVALV